MKKKEWDGKVDFSAFLAFKLSSVAEEIKNDIQRFWQRAIKWINNKKSKPIRQAAFLLFVKLWHKYVRHVIMHHHSLRPITVFGFVVILYLKLGMLIRAKRSLLHYFNPIMRVFRIRSYKIGTLWSNVPFIVCACVVWINPFCFILLFSNAFMLSFLTAQMTIGP